MHFEQSLKTQKYFFFTSFKFNDEIDISCIMRFDAY